MRLKRWWSVILALGLFMVLAPLSAQARPSRGFAPQPNRRAFTPPQTRGHANTWNRQPQHRQVFRGHANTWNRQPHRWQQPRGRAYGWNGQHRQWHQPRGHANAWNRQQHQWQQSRSRAYGWNGPQHPGQQQRNVYGRNNSQHQWQPGPAAGQHNNPGSAYNRAGYTERPQSANIAPNPSGYSHNTSTPPSRTGTWSGGHQPGNPGKTPVPPAPSTTGVI